MLHRVVQRGNAAVVSSLALQRQRSCAVGDEEQGWLGPVRSSGKERPMCAVSHRRSVVWCDMVMENTNKSSECLGEVYPGVSIALHKEPRMEPHLGHGVVFSRHLLS